MALERYVGTDQRFDPHWMEQIILQLGDTFDIRIVWDGQTAIMAGAFALAGVIVGHYAGGKVGAAVGAGLGGAAGVGVSSMVSLRELWSKIKDKLQELLYIVFNFLRQLDPIDYYNAFEILMACASSRKELVCTILEFIATKLGREVISSLTM